MYDICVIGGAGHVGLSLSIALADKGKRVAIYDINEESIAAVQSASMPFKEEGAEEVLRGVIGKTLFAFTNPEVISESKFVIVVIGTPVDRHLNPEYQGMKDFFHSIMPYLRDGQIIILRSTIYPGITEKINSLVKENYPNIELCFCPERIAEGKAMEELYTLPQIVSGFNDEAVAKVTDLFKLLTNEVITSTPIEAELSKLFTNSWRYIQFATANQFYMIAEEYGVDFYKIYDAMTHEYPRTKGFPKPGFAAGPCLFKDTMQISAFSNNKFFLGHSAMLINEGLPNFLVEQMKKQFDLRKLTVGILGMAFKGESDDPRESLSYKLRKILAIESKEVLCSDQYIKSKNFVTAEELIDKCDVLVLGAPHKAYLDLDFKGKEVVDVWNLTGKKGLSF